MRVPFYDLARQTAEIAADFAAASQAIVSEARFVKGPRVASFEDAWARHTGVAHVVATSSGTTALELALRCLDVGEGDEVICPAMTFGATVGAVLAAGARPVLADVDRATGLISPRAVASALSPRTRAIVPVHLYGRVADVAKLRLVAGPGVRIVEDAAQAHGARVGDVCAGALGDVAAFSFFPSKNLGCCGDGGALATSDPAIAGRARRLRDHGRATGDLHAERGFNFRMGELSAAWLSLSLPLLERRNAARARLALAYRAALAGIADLELPPASPPTVWHLYVVVSPRAPELALHLAARGIETGRHYPRAIHQHPAFAPFFGGERYPEAERFAAHGLSLPLFPGMTDPEQAAVIDAVRAFFGAG